jgi:protease-4
MRSFFKIFLASFLALVVFVIVFFFFAVGFVSSIASSPVEQTGANAVLVIDLGESYAEKGVTDPLAGFSESRFNTPGVYDVIRMIRYAKRTVQ